MKCSACPSEKVFAGGLCSACYNRKRRRGTTERKNVVNSGDCSVEGCNRHAFSKNLCSKHYQQAQHPLRALWRNLRSRAFEGYPSAWNRFDAFLAAVGERPSPHHQLRRLDPTKAWKPGNFVWREPIEVSFQWDRQGYMKRWNLRKKYGLTLEQIEEMARAQNGCCPICLRGLGAPNEKGKPTKVCVDHDHVTRKVRGLLCDPCNKGIGQMNDDVRRMRSAISYLEHYADVHSCELPQTV